MTKSVDSISVCLSKGLGAPVGSVLIGSAEFIGTARRWRKAVGGGMRQAGVIAAAGIVSLTQMVDRLAEDHANAKTLSENIKDIKYVKVWPVETNIIFVEIKEEFYEQDKRSAPIVVQLLRQKGVWTSGVSARIVRLVIHLHISAKDVAKVSQYIHEVFETL